LDLAIAVAGIIALRTASVVLVELLVGIVHSAGDARDPDLVVPARESREPNARFDSVELAVNIDFLELVDQNYCWIAQKRDIADSELDLEPFVGPVADLLHQFAGFGSAPLHVGIIPRQHSQHIGRHTPYTLGRWQHRCANLSLAFGKDV